MGSAAEKRALGSDCMLCISMQAGDYFTVGSDTVIQLDRLRGEQVHLTINAPREVPILRGEVLERNGGQRPACVMDKSPRHTRQLPWNPAKKAALEEIRATLAGMEDSPEVRLLRKRLDFIFPTQPGGAEASAHSHGFKRLTSRMK